MVTTPLTAMDQHLFPDPFSLLFFFLLFVSFLSTVIFFIFSLFFFFSSFSQTLLQLWWIVFLLSFIVVSFYFLSLSLCILFATLVDRPIYMFLREISTVSFLRSSIVHEVFCLPSNSISVTFTGFPRKLRRWIFHAHGYRSFPRRLFACSLNWTICSR